jgi:hypothetical protein
MASVSNITNRVINKLGRAEQVMVTTAANQKGACVGLSLANLTHGVVKASVMITDATSVKGYFVKDLLIAPNSSARVINGGEKLLLAASNSISVVCDTNNGLDVVFSLVVITYT